MLFNPVSHLSQSPGSARVQSQVSIPFVVQAKGMLNGFCARKAFCRAQSRAKSNVPAWVENRHVCD